MTLTLLHTSPVHVATFAKLRDRIAPKARLKQEVREAWLTEARTAGVGPELASRLRAFVDGAGGPVICTCTTLGPAAEAAGAERVDRPMMREAGRIGGRIVMAYALESTARPSLDLLAGHLGPGGTVRPFDLSEHWELFESGDVDGFHAALVAAIREEVRTHGGDCVVLAQVSMAGAAKGLKKLGVPVLSSPETALRAGLGLA